MDTTYPISTCDLQVLDGMIELLSDPKRWTREVYARDKHGMAVDEYSDRAVAWCARGAQYKLEHDLGCASHLRQPLQRWMQDHGMSYTLVGLNDVQGHEALMSVLRRFRAAVEVVDEVEVEVEDEDR